MLLFNLWAFTLQIYELKWIYGRKVSSANNVWFCARAHFPGINNIIDMIIIIPAVFYECFLQDQTTELDIEWFSTYVQKIIHLRCSNYQYSIRSKISCYCLCYFLYGSKIYHMWKTTILIFFRFNLYLV